ncbi:MAG: fumarylacetoacetate hydrolase family protein, partial [Ilumatobacteraceae bacterium]
HDDRRTLDPISDRHPELTMGDAYLVQDALTGLRVRRGQKRVGWKLGYTSQVMRRQMGIAEANFGPLTDEMLLDQDDDVMGRYVQPRVEPEVALRFGCEVPGDADRSTVLDSVSSAHGALEVVDSAFTDYRFRIEDNTADGSSAAGVVVGDEIDLGTIVDVDVRLLVDGVEVGRGRGRDASGHPADGVVWLVRRLAAQGRAIRAGDVVITGGLTAAHALVPGGRITAVFDGVERACVRHGRTTLD